MQRIASKPDELARVLKGICTYNKSTGEFLLPIIDRKKGTLNSLKKMFDGTSFLFKSLNLVKVEDKFHVLVVKGNKEN